jgi:aminoglycoside phosphotransferase (APT) family kinase protein
VGFGEIEGPFYPTWLDYMSARIGEYHRDIHAERHRETVSAYVMGVIDRSFERMPEILAGANREASLVHSDYNLWNVLFDPATYRVTGIIDPIDAGWNDREIDLFHLPNCRPDVGLLERYLERAEVNGTFPMRHTFYRFWDDIKHYLRVGWYEEGHFRRWADALQDHMHRQGL